MAPKYKVYVDWSGDETFTGSYEDVTGEVLDGRQPVTSSYGRDTIRTGSPISGGQAAFTLNNLSRLFSPENTSGPLAGQVLPGRSVYIKAINNGVDYPLFRGALDEFELGPSYADRTISVGCLDGLARLRGTELSTRLYRGVRTGEALNIILDKAGWSSTARDIDAGASFLPYWWLSRTDAFDAIMELVDSEGQPALVTIGTDGKFVFRDRHHRVTRSASTTSQSTWRSGGTEPLVGDPASYDHGWSEIINSITFEVQIRQPTDALQVVWTAPGRLDIAAGETITIDASLGSAVMDAVVPVSGVDYQVRAGSIETVLPYTSGQAFTLQVTAIGGDAVIDNFQLRARSIETVSTISITVEDVDSIGKYGRRSGSTERGPIWANQYDARAIAEILIGRRAQRLPTMRVTMVGANSSRLTQMLTRTLSDRVRLIENHTGLDAEMFVERVEHSISQGGLEHRTTFGLEKSPTSVGTPLTFGVAGAGFNDGKFQALGVLSGTAAFRFDTASQGFDQGIFAY